MDTTPEHPTMRRAPRLVAAAAAALLTLGLAACDTGTSVEGGGTAPDDAVGDDTGATGEGFDDVDVEGDTGDGVGADTEG